MSDDFHSFPSTISDSAIIRQHIRIRDYGAKETIIIEKDDSAQVYFILSGKVKVTSFHINGKEVWHAALSAGYTFGEMAAISGASRSASVITLAPSRIGILSQAHFLAALEAEPGLALYFLKDMVARLQTTTLYSNERIALDIPARICAELLRQAASAPTADGGYPVSRDLTVTALAERINAKRETVSRHVSSFIEIGHVKKKGRQFIVLDKAALEARVEG